MNEEMVGTAMNQRRKGRLLFRYLNLPLLFDFLVTKQVVLPNPKSWDDKNDAYFLDEYARANDFPRVHALCLTEASETYHHWKVFTLGSNGACIVFRKDEFIERATQEMTGMRAQSVEYLTISQLRSRKPLNEELPFLKRHAFRDELEFRLVAPALDLDDDLPRFTVPLSCVEEVRLNPWLQRNVAKQVKVAVNSIVGCKTLVVRQSTLVENESWKRVGKLSTAKSST